MSPARLSEIFGVNAGVIKGNSENGPVNHATLSESMVSLVDEANILDVPQEPLVAQASGETVPSAEPLVGQASEETVPSAIKEAIGSPLRAYGEALKEPIGSPLRSL